ncbi:hypothetical protein [Ectothiorhodospira shaposhnikovii]|uniref:hypothetical protein n=1 Tax=Ectothiorhodospira shaposhnikovii TaxID=1054 RepID=UPI001EE98F3B|nr:hypothetical protein [Ectothiorhodospira shaposhnikovii]MCG5512812.1 hypothetical protein [Ectothiorhodospira shaposhnikovii]
MSTYEQFLSDVKDHEITVFQNDGPYRTVRFAIRDKSQYHFYLTTWPGHLVISGDMGTYAFRRLTDMFQFFRGKPGKINPGYWHEKLISQDVRTPAESFSREQFKAAVVKEWRKYWRNSFRDRWANLDTFFDDRRDDWREIRRSILENEDLESADLAFRETQEFDSLANLYLHGYDLNEYTYHFIWCLHAIVWGIGQYDAHMAAKEEEKRSAS